ncbi:MAG: class II glutamine amidotransferase [Myxococcota bacterium]
MCELFAMSARYPATVNFSLQEFSRHGGLSAHHRHGWGIAYLQERDAWVIKEPGPASSSDLVRYIEARRLGSTTVISHVRHASSAVAFENTHPFSRELAGRRHVFAHNGDVPDVFESRALRLGRFRPMGDTDSEHAFCALLARQEDLWLGSSGVPKLEERLAIVDGFARELRRLGTANFLYWDGDVLFAHGHKRRSPGVPEARPPGLAMLSRTCAIEAAPLSEGSAEEIPASREQRVLLAASVPLTDEKWEALIEGELIAVSGGAIVARVAP